MSDAVLDFSDAMDNFRSMFPNLDDEIIEQVLRANNGSVDSTIETLLKLSVEEPPPQSVSEVRLGVEDVSDLIGIDDINVKTTSNWKPALLRPLPVDFLVINGSNSTVRSQEASSSAGSFNLTTDALSQRMRENEEFRANAGMDDDLNAYLEDERLAIMLQNEEFVNMISQDPELMEAMTREQRAGGSASKYQTLPDSVHPSFHGIFLSFSKFSFKSLCFVRISAR